MNRNLFFNPTNILLPAHADMRRWSVIACDQFTADAGYWQTVQNTVGDAPSTLRLMLPEFYLGKCDEGAATREIQQTMHRYLDGGVFRTVPHSLVLVQRTLPGGAIRCGIVGALDLEAYDYAPDSVTPIRATEGTVASRLPARVRIRAAATLEMPHIMVFYSDPDDAIFRDALAAANETLYDFDLMSGGGHVRGLRVVGMDADALAARLCATGVGTDSAHPMRFAIADGNHSLAAARLCWLEKKQSLTPEQAAVDPARYALVELENIHDPAQVFEPIHRVVTGCDPKALRKALESQACAEGGFPVTWYAGEESGTVLLDRSLSELAVGVLQGFLDSYLADHPGEVDYIHDDDALIALAKQPNAIGFLLPAMEKSQLFRGVIADGILPRKTFSMGHSREKRYYLEGRKIK